MPVATCLRYSSRGFKNLAHPDSFLPRATKSGSMLQARALTQSHVRNEISWETNPDSGCIVVESLETDVHRASFHSAGIYLTRFIAWKRSDIHLLFRQNQMDTLLCGHRSTIPMMYLSVWYIAKNQCLTLLGKNQMARTRKDFPYVYVRGQFSFFKAC